MPVKLLLVGARATRQGTGPYVAAALARAGRPPGAIVGTSRDSVNAAVAELREQLGIRCTGYTDLETALAAECPDAVALCSPWQFHAGQLAAVAAAGCHCLVEKPLAWPAGNAEVDGLVDAFEERGLLLQMVNQWPCTLASFSALHGPLPAQAKRFAMRLSPISAGPDMITDAAPHFIGMLQALLGPGSCEDIEVESGPDGDADRLLLRCQYRRPAGATAASLLLLTCPRRPRPAWYQIDDMRVDREVAMPRYQQYFRSGDRRIALPDPLEQVVDQFLDALPRDPSQPPATDGSALRQGHRNLLRLADALPGASGVQLL